MIENLLRKIYEFRKIIFAQKRYIVQLEDFVIKNSNTFGLNAKDCETLNNVYRRVKVRTKP